MKITDIKTFLIWEGTRNYTFVKVETDEGIYGIGEAGITWKEWAMEGAVRHFRDILIGEDPAGIEHIWQLLYRGGFFPGGKILSSAVSAIDIALWDILGKSLGVPVYKLLGGKVRDKVVCYWTPSGTPYFDIETPGVIYGLRLSTQKADVLRALLEGVAFEMKLNINILEASGININELRAIGGGAKSRIWIQLKANILNKPIAIVNDKNFDFLVSLENPF